MLMTNLAWKHKWKDKNIFLKNPINLRIEAYRSTAITLSNAEILMLLKDI